MQTLTGKSVPEQISDARDNYPHAIALSNGDEQMTYEELDNRADQFANYLVQLGIGPRGTVAVCLERSFDWIVAALGIMRAGAAYVPLDSAWPESRLRFAVKDSGSTVLVARAEFLARLRCKLHDIDPRRDAEKISTALGSGRKPIHPEDLAYVIYTSGSTGVPKGVEITHFSLSHVIGWYRDTFGVAPPDRASHLLGLGFDAAVLEIWGHLCAGATLCFVDDGVRSSPRMIQQWIVRERITISLVPAILGTRLMAVEWPTTTSLRLLVTGGDTLYRGPNVELPFKVVNQYGPTECTVVSTCAVLKPGASGTPPIGLPISGATIYLLDEEGEPVPDGVVGEIYIGGSVIGRGYRNLPNLTLSRFLPDPFAGAPGARMYRTGDRGVRRPGGQIRFRGRLDRQTKIRGHRVELDEIGSVLTRHPSIDFATAVTRVSQDGENQLVAYVLPKENARVPTSHELQEQLLRSLPDYMVPAIFVRLQSLPMASSGKLDLKLLPKATNSQLLEGIAAKAPATTAEEKVLTIVQDLLENDSISGEHNFFLAGGHSLLGMQLLMRLRKAFGVKLTLRQLFESPTVESLALLVDRAFKEERLAAIWADLLGRKNVGLDDDFFDLGGDLALVVALQRRITAEFHRQIAIDELVQNPTIRRLTEIILRRTKIESVLPPGVLALQPEGNRNTIFWLHYLDAELGKVIGGDQPLLYVTLTAEDLSKLGKRPTLQSIASSLSRKILTTQPKGPYTLGGRCLGGILAFEIASQLRDAGQNVSLVVLVDPPNPSSIDSTHALKHLFDYIGYAVRRAGRLGLGKSLAYLSEHVVEYFVRILGTKSTKTEMGIIQTAVKRAALQYHPRQYDGKVLLLVASERPPHVDRQLEWQSVVPRNLHTHYIGGHHRDLLDDNNVRIIADAIRCQLNLKTDGQSVSSCTEIPRSTGSSQTRKLRTA